MENKFFDQNNATYQSKQALKNGIKQIKSSKKKLSQSISFVPFNDADPSNRVKARQKKLFLFPFVMSGFSLLFKISYFLKNPINDQLEHFVFITT